MGMDDDLYAIFAQDDESPGDEGSAPMVALLHELVALSGAIDEELADLVVDEALKTALADVRSIYNVLNELESRVRTG
jgi:hypothetical protein